MTPPEAAPVVEAEGRNFSPWAYWMSRLEEVAQAERPAADAAQLGPWRLRLGERLRGLLGPWPAKVPLSLEVLSTVHCDGYVRQHVVFDAEETMSVPAYLLVPDGREGPGPAVLAAHGHGPGKDQICGLASTGAPNADYALQLARRGFVVLAPDLRCFGERSDRLPPNYYLCDTNLVHAVLAGRNPLTENIWDMQRALDVLGQHPLVDERRMGMVGHSYGGTVTLFVSALDERVAACVVSGFFSSWAAGHAVALNLCGSQVLFGMLGQLEHADVAALIAPRPLLVETGARDRIWPLPAAESSMAQARAIYLAMGAPEAISHDVFDGGHEWHGVEAYSFLHRWLNPSAGQVRVLSS